MLKVKASVWLEALGQIFALKCSRSRGLNIQLPLSRQQFNEGRDHVPEILMLIRGNHYLEPPAVIRVPWFRPLAPLFHQSLVGFPTDVVQDDLLGHLFWRS